MIKNALDNPRLKAETFKARFLEAGVVEYDGRRVLIKPENLMKMALKFKGAKVIVDHKEVTAKNANEIVGYMNNIWLGDDGWAWCDFTVNDEEAVSLINKGYSVSCCYLAVESGSGGTKNAVSYDSEVIDMEEDDEVTHLAIVENPRYEDAIILKNSIKNKVMNIFKLTSKKEKKENSIKEIELESAAFEIDGAEVSVSDLMKAYKNEKEKEEKENELDEKAKVNAEDEFEVDGKMVKVSEMAKAYKSSKKNEEDEAKKNAEDEDEKKKEKENAEEEEKVKDEEKKKEAKKNSVDAENLNIAKAKFENGSSSEEFEIITDEDRFAKGSAIYGTPQKITN